MEHLIPEYKTQHLARLCGNSTTSQDLRSEYRLVTSLMSDRIEDSWNRCLPYWLEYGRVKDLSHCIRVPRYLPSFARLLGSEFARRFHRQHHYLMRMFDQYSPQSYEYLIAYDLLCMCDGYAEMLPLEPLHIRRPIPAVVKLEMLCEPRFDKLATIGEYITQVRQLFYSGWDHRNDTVFINLSLINGDRSLQSSSFTQDIAAIKRLQNLGFDLVFLSDCAPNETAGDRHRDSQLTTLAENGISWLGHYHCHHPFGKRFQCCKPRIGLLKRASIEHQFDFAKSIVIGSDVWDVLRGQQLGIFSVLVRSGLSNKSRRLLRFAPEYTTHDMETAINFIEESALTEKFFERQLLSDHHLTPL